MTAAEYLTRAKAKLSITDTSKDTLLGFLISDAMSFIMAYTGRDAVPSILDGTVTEIAVMYYNRQGMEGQSSHNEGGISITVDTLPENIRQQLNAQRLARVVSMWV